jgi:hypothetical protein
MRLQVIFSGLGWLALSAALASPFAASAQSVQVTPTSVPGTGGKVSVQWSAPGRAGQDNWIGMYRVGTPADSANLARPYWKWAKGESGSLQFDMPNWPGQYVFRLFYGGGYDLRATSNAFTVQGTGTTPPIEPSAVSIRVTPESATAGGKASVQWNAPGRTGQNNWIGLYRAGTPADSANLIRPFWQWANGESGTVELSLPNAPGQYVFRFFYGGGYDLRATSKAFTVQGGTPPPVSSKSLTGAWVHSADGTTKTPDSKVIVLHEGNQVTLVATYKMEVNRNQWQTYRCMGQLSGNELPVQCRWVEGGNPMSYGDTNWTMNFQVTPDRDHLNYKHTKPGPGQDAYYSRVP